MTTPALHGPALPARWRHMALATMAALALHAVLLGGLPDLSLGAADAGAAAAPGAAPLQVRQITAARSPDQAPPGAPAAAPAVTAAAAAAPAFRRPRAAPTTAAAPASAASGAELLMDAPAAAAHAAATPASAPTVPAAEPPTVAAADASPPIEAGAARPPQYRTQAAPAATLLFDLKRGLAGGQAVLQWRPDSNTSPGYSLTLQAQAFGIAVAAWNSSGRFDAAGLAPDRYAESRRSREVRATHFQRAADKISFSAQGTEFPLPPGVQDRSSWMLQLGAILQAHPELAQPGAQVSLVVVGTRGAPEPWLFTVQGRAPLALGSSDATTLVADTVHLVREPRRPYDTRVNVWLDPARHHLPVKLQLLTQATGEGQEFELRELTLP